MQPSGVGRWGGGCHTGKRNFLEKWRARMGGDMSYDIRLSQKGWGACRRGCAELHLKESGGGVG